MKITNKTQVKKGMYLLDKQLNRRLLVEEIVQHYNDQIVYFKGRNIDNNSEATYCMYLRDTQLEELEISQEEITILSERIKKYKAFDFARVSNVSIQSIGSDPEMFVTDKAGKMIPSFLFLTSKEEPQKTPEQSENVFWDGYQAEFNIQAGSCLAYRCDSTQYGLKHLLKLARKFDPKAKLTIKSTFDLTQMDFDIAKPEHIAFGCMPSKNVYGHKGLQAEGKDVTFRSAGGHVHIGLVDSSKKNIPDYVKALDKILGVACVSLFAGFDEPRRREMYGLAGEYRTPKHGLEYRTLSNAWLAHPLLMNMVFELARMSVGTVDNKIIDRWNATEQETIDCINNCDVEAAREILARNKYYLINLINNKLQDRGEILYKIFMNGMTSIIENPDDVEGNWGLGKEWRTHCGGDGMNIQGIAKNKLFESLIAEKTTEIYEQLVDRIDEVDTTETAVVGKKKVTA